MEPRSPTLQVDSLLTQPPGNPHINKYLLDNLSRSSKYQHLAVTTLGQELGFLARIFQAYLWDYVEFYNRASLWLKW